MTTVPKASENDFARSSLDESLTLITESLGTLVATMLRVSGAQDPQAAMQELAEACVPFVDVHNRAGWVGNAYSVGRAEYTEHIAKTAPLLRP
jgi:hypothetical protein